MIQIHSHNCLTKVITKWLQERPKWEFPLTDDQYETWIQADVTKLEQIKLLKHWWVNYELFI